MGGWVLKLKLKCTVRNTELPMHIIILILILILILIQQPAWQCPDTDAAGLWLFCTYKPKGPATQSVKREWKAYHHTVISKFERSKHFQVPTMPSTRLSIVHPWHLTALVVLRWYYQVNRGDSPLSIFYAAVSGQNSARCPSSCQSKV